MSPRYRTYGPDEDPLSRVQGIESILRSLIIVERFPLVDVGLMFGLSHSRMDQIAKEHGLARGRGGACMQRIWDDRASRFVPTTRGHVNQIRVKHRAANRRERKVQKHEPIRQRILKALADLRSKLEREPTSYELWIAVGGEPMSGRRQSGALVRLMCMWGWFGSFSVPTRLRLVKFRSETGFWGRSAGRPGSRPVLEAKDIRASRVTRRLGIRSNAKDDIARLDAAIEYLLISRQDEGAA